MSQRESGFYWVRVTDDEWCPAMWCSIYKRWWVASYCVSFEEREVEGVDERRIVRGE